MQTAEFQEHLNDVRRAEGQRVYGDNKNGDVRRFLFLRGILGLVLPRSRRAIDSALSRAAVDGYILGLATGLGEQDKLQSYDQGTRAKPMTELVSNVIATDGCSFDPAIVNRLARDYIREEIRGGDF